jgi:hypothetical protein
MKKTGAMIESMGKLNPFPFQILWTLKQDDPKYGSRLQSYSPGSSILLIRLEKKGLETKRSCHLAQSAKLTKEEFKARFGKIV